MTHSPSQSDHPCTQSSEATDAIDWLRILKDISRQVNVAPEAVQDTLQQLLEKLVADIGADAAAVWTPEPMTDFLAIYASHGLSERYVRYFNKTDRVKIGHGLVGGVMENRQSQSFTNFEEYAQHGVPRWANMVRTEQIEAILSVPLFVGDALYGTFNLYYHHPHPFSTAETAFAETLANQIAVIFENKKQSERLQEDGTLYKKQRDELLSIGAVVRSVDSAIYTNPTTAIEGLSQYIAEAYAGHGVAILHETDTADRLQLVGAHNISTEQIAYLETGGTSDAFSSLVNILYDQKQPVTVDRVFTHPAIEKPWATILSKERIMSLAAFPLTAGERVVGVFMVYYNHLHDFTEDETSVLNTFGQFLAVSLENVASFNSLASEKRKTQSMVDSLQDGLLVYDLSGTIIDSNPAATELLALDQKTTAALEAGDPVANQQESIARINATVIPEFQTVPITFELPEKRILEVTHVPLHNEHYHAAGAMRILHDVTEEHRLQELKTNFVATATHQMRTPLTGVRWGLNSLDSEDAGTLSKQQHTLLAKLIKTNDFVISLVNNLLDVSRIEERKKLTDGAEVDLLAIVKQTIEHESISITERALSVHVESATPTACITGNKIDLELALQNLIDNAIKYTLEHGSITITFDQSDTWVSIDIADTGIGISAADQKVLFSKFFRAKNAVLVETDGSGLGLFLTKKIIEMHGGSITVTSDLDRGTTFHITLPKQPPE